MDCDTGHGGALIEGIPNPYTNLTISECKQACIDQEDCEGFIRSAQCWLRTNIDLTTCNPTDKYTTYVKGEGKVWYFLQIKIKFSRI